MSTPTSLYLAVGDADLHDALNLNDGAIWLPQPNKFTANPPFVRTFRSRTKGTARTVDTFRTVSVEFLLLSPNDDFLYAQIAALEWKLEQARAMSGPYAEDGRGVCLWVSFGQSAQFSYFDVDDGQVTVLRGDDQYGASVASQVVLDLTCRPYAHRQPRTYGPFGPLTIGTGAHIYLPNLPGSAPGLLQLTLADASGNGEAFSAYRIATCSLPNLGSSDYNAWADAQPYQAGVAHADTSALDGVSLSRLTLSNTFQGCALIATPGGASDHGQDDCFLLVRDFSSLMLPPSNLQSNSGSGSTCIGVVTALDASGNESAGSTPTTLTVNGSSATLTWAAPTLGTPAKYRLYLYGYSWTSGTLLTAWGYVQTTTAVTTITISAATTATAATPPTVAAAALQGAQLVPYYGILGPNGNPTALIPGALVQTQIANGSYEIVPLGAPTLPPIATPEGGTAPPWCMVLEARSPGSLTPNLDISGLWRAKGNQPSTEIDLGPAGNGAPVVVVIDTRRGEQVGAAVSTQYLAPSRTNLVGEYLWTEGSGTTAHDTSASANTATLQTGSSFATDSAVQTPGSPASNCVHVASGSGVTIATSTGLPTGNGAFTIVAAVKLAAWAACNLLSWGTGANAQTALALTTTGFQALWATPNLAAVQNLLAAWHVLAVTWDGTTRRLYLDGAQVASDTPSAHAAVSGSYVIGSGGFTGWIGPTRVYSRALSAFEIASYQGVIAGLVGQASVTAPLFLGPGNGLIAIDADVAGGVHDTTSAAVTVTVRFTPRDTYLHGSV